MAFSTLRPAYHATRPLSAESGTKVHNGLDTARPQILLPTSLLAEPNPSLVRSRVYQVVAVARLNGGS